MGTIEQKAGHPAEAAKAWERAADLLRPLAGGTATLFARDCYARALFCLGRVGEARPVAEQLLAMGYVPRQFVELCRENGLKPTGGRSRQ